MSGSTILLSKAKQPGEFREMFASSSDIGSYVSKWGKTMVVYKDESLPLVDLARRTAAAFEADVLKFTAEQQAINPKGLEGKYRRNLVETLGKCQQLHQTAVKERSLATKIANFIVHFVTFRFIKNLFISTPLDKHLQELEEHQGKVGIFIDNQWDKITRGCAPLETITTADGQIFKKAKPEDRLALFEEAIKQERVERQGIEYAKLRIRNAELDRRPTQADLDAAKEEVPADAQNRIDNLDRALSKANQQNNGLREELCQSKSEAARLKEDYDNSVRMLRDATDRANDLQKELSQSKSEVVRLNADFNAAVEDLRNSEEQLNSAAQKVTDLEADLSESQREVAQLKQDLNDARAEVAQLKQDQYDLDDNPSEAETDELDVESGSELEPEPVSS